MPRRIASLTSPWRTRRRRKKIGQKRRGREAKQGKNNDKE